MHFDFPEIAKSVRQNAQGGIASVEAWTLHANVISKSQKSYDPNVAARNMATYRDFLGKATTSFNRDEYIAQGLQYLRGHPLLMQWMRVRQQRPVLVR